MGTPLCRTITCVGGGDFRGTRVWPSLYDVADDCYFGLWVLCFFTLTCVYSVSNCYIHFYPLLSNNRIKFIMPTRIMRIEEKPLR